MAKLHELLVAPVMKESSEHFVQCSDQVIKYSAVFKEQAENLLSRIQRGETIHLSDIEALGDVAAKMEMAAIDSRDSAQMVNDESAEIIDEFFSE